MSFKLSASLISVVLLALCTNNLVNGAAGDAVESNHLLEFSDLMRSKASSKFQSTLEFTDSCTKFAAQRKRMRKHGSLEFETEKDHHLVKLSNTCDGVCHAKLAAEFSNPHDYSVIDSTHVIVHGTDSKLTEIGAKFSGLIEFSSFMHPLMKIDRDLTSFVVDSCVDSEQTSKQVSSAHKSMMEFSGSVLRGEAPISVAENEPALLKHRNQPKTTKAVKTASQGSVSVKVTLSPLASQAEVGAFAAFLTTLSAEITFDTAQPFTQRMRALVTFPVCSAEATSAVLEQLAARTEVQWMERSYEMQKHNEWARGVCDAGSYDSTPLNDAGITGGTEIVGIADSGLDMNSCFFYDDSVAFNYQTADGPMVLNTGHRKVIQYISFGDSRDDDDGHGTHVAGTVAGKNSGSNHAADGMSYEAKIAFYDIGYTGNDSLSVPLDLESGLFDKMYAAGARVFSNSWGNNYNGYDDNSAAVDAFMYNNPDAIVLFSAGNRGDYGPHMVSAPSTNKNGIAVGASLNDFESWEMLAGANTVAGMEDILNVNNVAYFSSEGPTSDKRLKPDVLAAGYYIRSAAAVFNNLGTEHCFVQYMAGTSMATPAAAGYAAKVRQYFTQGYYPSGVKQAENAFVPSGALIKAMMVHGTQAMDNVVHADYGAEESAGSYPSDIQGYGRIQMSEVLNFGNSSALPLSLFVVGAPTSSDARYVDVSTAAPTKTFTFESTNNGTVKPIRITFAYTDYPGLALANNVMMNKLSVTATDDRGNTYTPYLSSGTIQSNLQVIDIDAPAVNGSSTITVTVTANTLIMSPQSFALVVSTRDSIPEATPQEQSGSDDSALEQFVSIGVPIIVVIGGLMLITCIVCLCMNMCRGKQQQQQPQQQQPQQQRSAGGAKRGVAYERTPVTVEMVEAVPVEHAL